MGDSVGLQIIKAYAAALDIADPEKPAGVTIHRSRYRPVEKDDLPAIVVYSIVEEVETANQQRDKRRTFRLRAELRAKGDPPDDALDPLRVWAVKRAMDDVTFGGLAKDVREVRTAWVAESFTEILGAAAVDFEAWYETTGDDLEAIK